MKKLVVFILVVAIIVIAISEAKAYSLRILPQTGAMDVNSAQPTVTFNIVFHPDTGGSLLGNWNFNLFYDSSELTWNSTQTSVGAMPSPLSASLFGTPFENTTGLIENFNGLLSPPNAISPTITADLMLATIVFDVTAGVSDGNADVWIDNSDLMHFNVNGSPVLLANLPVVAGLDSDNDGIADDGDLSGVIGDNKCTAGNTTNCDDNCYLTSNSGQQDTDGDMYGNMCDSDIDNNGNVGISDFNIFKLSWFATEGSPNYNADADFDSNGNVGISDFNIFKARWFTNAPWY